MNKKITFVGKVFLNSQKYKYLKLYMSQFGGKDSKRHFTVVMDSKEHGLYVSSTPSSAARKAVTKLCTANKSKKVEFHIREITQGSKKKTYGPYLGHIEKLKEPIELKGRVIKYKPVAKLSGKKSEMKGGGLKIIDFVVDYTKKGNNGGDPTYKYDSSWRSGGDKLFFGKIFPHTELEGKTSVTRNYFPFVLYSDSTTYRLYEDVNSKQLEIYQDNFYSLENNPNLPKPNDKFSTNMNKYLKELHEARKSKAYFSSLKYSMNT